jgi:hypothetical protein
LASAIGNRRFSLSAFVKGDYQGLPPDLVSELQSALYEVLNSINNLEPVLSLQNLKKEL